MKTQNLFGQRLVTRQQQAARIATSIRLTHQFQKRHQMLVVTDLTLKLFGEIECHMRPPLAKHCGQFGKVVSETQ